MARGLSKRQLHRILENRRDLHHLHLSVRPAPPFRFPTFTIHLSTGDLYVF